MTSRFTHPRSPVVLTSILTIAVSVSCSASRSASPPAQVTDNPTIGQSSSPIVSSSAEEKAACGLDMSQAPVMNGLKLRMTTEEVLALFPGSKEDAELRTDLAKPPNRYGGSNFVIKPSKYESREKFPDVSQVSFVLLDGRVSTFSVSYSGREWPHVDKFVEKFVQDTNLPAVDQWQATVGMENQLKTLRCADFEVRVFAGGEAGRVSYVLFQDLEADEKLKERRRKAREQARPTPGQ